MNKNKIKSCGLIVLFNPNIKLLNNVIKSLLNEVDKIFIYDNSQLSIRNLFNAYNGEFEYLHESSNIGIAAAQNKLIKLAISQNFKVALLSDQDTVYPKNYMQKMLKYLLIQNNIIALVPNRKNVNHKFTKDAGHYVFDKENKLKLIYAKEEYISVSHSIASGMILNLKYIDNTKLMNENLFIDWVDNEWCWRMVKLNFMILCIPNIIINHSLGDSSIKILNKKFVKRNSIRNYYIIRNALYLLLYSNFKKYNKTINKYLFKKVVQHSLFSIVASNEKKKQFVYILRAISNAITKKLGEINEK